MDVPPLDEAAMTAAYDLLARTHGKLDGLATWLAGTQGRVPPRPWRLRRVVAFGSADLDVDVTLPPGSFDDGRAVADREVDAGADGFVLVSHPTVPAVAAVAALTGSEPVEVAPSGPEWAATVAAVRDTLRAQRGAAPLDLAGALGLAAAAGFLAGAARRRTPVVLDGVAPAAAALVATRLVPEAVTYFVAGHRTPHPAHRVALDRLGLEPLLDLGITADGGALLALPLLDAAAALLGEYGAPDGGGDGTPARQSS